MSIQILNLLSKENSKNTDYYLMSFHNIQSLFFIQQGRLQLYCLKSIAVTLQFIKGCKTITSRRHEMGTLFQTLLEH